MGLVWGRFAVNEIGKSISPRSWFLALMGALIGLLAGTVWSGFAGFISHWFEGWAFFVWIGACLICILLGFLTGLAGAAVLKRWLSVESTVNKWSPAFLILAIISFIVFIIIPAILLAFGLPQMWIEGMRTPL